jgi:sugar (pentulose or hexulose) kinase
MTEYRLVYDSGSKVLKCAIADELGKIISLESWEEEVIIGEDGLYREWNHKNYWENLINLTKITIKSAKIDPKKIKYITASSIRPSCVFTDDENKAVYIGASFECRGINYAEDIEREFKERAGISFYESTGHFPSLLFLPARFKYFKEEREKDGRIGQITQYLPMESWILVKFGGEIHANIASAGESGFFDVNTKLWHPAWEDILDLPDYFFPFPVMPGEIIGTISEYYEESLGLSSETQLVAGISDTQAAMLGCQCVELGSIGAVLGTTSPVQAISSRPHFYQNETLWNGLFVCKNLFDYYYLETSTGITGQLLKWAANLFFADKGLTLRQKFQELDKAYYEYDRFELQSNKEQIDESCIFSLLGPSPLASTQMGTNSGLFYFQSPGGVDEIDVKKNAFISAVFDNIQFAVTKNIEFLVNYAKIENPNYSIVGGITRNSTFLQRFADLLQTSIISSKNDEASIQGLLVLCDVAAGKIKNLKELKSRNESLQLLRKIEPREAMKQKLLNRYNNWSKIFQQFNKNF